MTWTRGKLCKKFVRLRVVRVVQVQRVQRGGLSRSVCGRLDVAVVGVRVRVRVCV